MFTGIIETIGIIHAITPQNDCIELIIRPHQIFDDLSIGDSLAVNGVCLTLTHIDLFQNLFYVTVVPETLRVTNLDQLKINSEVNLERALKIGSRLNGHFVQGHVDTTAQISDIHPDGKGAWLVKFSLPSQYTCYLINKGFVAIDGMSITVIEAAEKYFTVTFIPHTIHETIVHNYQQNDYVNIEVDMTAKSLQKLLPLYLNEHRLF